MQLYADKDVWHSPGEEKTVRSFLERDLTLDEQWQRYYNTERKLLYQAIHPEYSRRKIEPYPKPKPPNELDKPRGETPIEVRFIYPRIRLPEKWYLLEFGSTARHTSTDRSDVDLLYIGREEEFPGEYVKDLLTCSPLQHHGALTATVDMLNYWPMDLIPVFLLQGAVAHCEHAKLSLWGAWYHREAVEEFVRSVMYWRTWHMREFPKDDYEVSLLCSMVSMFPCIFESAMRRPKPKAVANLMRPIPEMASFAYHFRAGGEIESSEISSMLNFLERESDFYMAAAIKQGMFA